jgi:antirestriction protein ArdC
VFTYHAWRALGRQVRRGEHGVKVVTFIATGPAAGDGAGDSATDAGGGAGAGKRRGGRRPWTATVFHVSQTDPIGESAPRLSTAGQACPA